ncbi:hypothetical protein [Rhodoferax sp. BLA1]|uniref:hypothetical protein n=1 Tax=Rhodoferax sp. BLA1 TaxID=2576062 RepID=UPI0015D2876E|nr:hypothetical protein [Rhodoferax sp. BLA1]
MRVDLHTAADFAQALRALLPPGEAWDWPAGGMGDQLLRGTAVELARVDAQVPIALDAAVELHRPVSNSWRLVDYQRVADASQAGITEALPRKPFVAGSGSGQRLWSGVPGTFAVSLTKLSFAKPFVAGSGAGQQLWGPRARHVLVVQYYKTVADVQALWDALMAFKQAHVYLLFMDITGSGGEVLNGQS